MEGKGIQHFTGLDIIGNGGNQDFWIQNILIVSALF